MLAQMGLHDFRMISFALKPKYHGLKQLAWDLKIQIERGSPLVLSPNMNSCESNEDCVGRICVLARRVSTRTIGFRVIQRFFLKSRALFVRHRKQHGPGFLYDKNM